MTDPHPGPDHRPSDRGAAEPRASASSAPAPRLPAPAGPGEPAAGRAAEAPAPAIPKPVAQRIRRWIVVVIVASFAIAAAAGIAVLLGGATSGPATKVLSTTALIGIFSVAALCGAALIGRRVQWFGWIAVGIAVVTLARLLWMIWIEPEWDEGAFKLTITLVILTGACSIASLLLLLVTHDRRPVRSALFATLAMLAAGVLLTLVLLWELVGDYPDGYLQATGIVWILAALGIVVLPVMSLLLRSPGTTAPHGPGAAGGGGPLTDQGPRADADPVHDLSRNSLERIAAAARAEGLSPDELVERLLP
ncbi:hypothetical protein [Leucobacter sp.]